MVAGEVVADGVTKCFLAHLAYKPNEMIKFLMKMRQKISISMLLCVMMLVSGVATAQNYVEQANCNLNMKMVYVSGGSFQMGTTLEQGGDADGDEFPIHTVTLSPYFIGECEVTQEQWQKIMGNNPSYFKGDSNCPVEMVSWEEAQNFCRELSRITGKRYSLPTEAQWEYAARGGEHNGGTKYSGGDSVDTVAWFVDNSDGSTHAVKQKAPNELGLYDMSGNVYEWCLDWFGDYSSSAQINPTGPSSGNGRVLRGGGWYFYTRSCRVSNRGSSAPSSRDFFVGFRVVCLL